MKKIIFIAALAASATFTMQAADIEAGKAKSAVCAACHGAAGISAVPTYPNLAGQKEAYLVKQIKDFKAGTRKDATMAPMIAPLSDEDAANIAAYYASLPAS